MRLKRSRSPERVKSSRRPEKGAADCLCELLIEGYRNASFLILTAAGGGGSLQRVVHSHDEDFFPFFKGRLYFVLRQHEGDNTQPEVTVVDQIVQLVSA